ncbi:hypothetical protein N9917_04110 [Deltaproteobacteria bacterium]|nr:hypothetical protein [Deltaproteobacteria bacterium]
MNKTEQIAKRLWDDEQNYDGSKPWEIVEEHFPGDYDDFMGMAKDMIPAWDRFAMAAIQGLLSSER